MNEENIISELNEEIPTEDALRILGFSKNKLGSFDRTWPPLDMSVYKWITGWMFVGNYVTNRSIGMPEFHIPDKVEPIKLLGAFYETWQRFIPEIKLPVELIPGGEYIERKRNIQRLLPSGPTLWADREFFRFCISYLEKHNDWVENDYELEFTHENEQLKLVANNSVIFCPAIGTWPGSVFVSARHFFRQAPRRFVDDVVRIGADINWLSIESSKIPARWVE